MNDINRFGNASTCLDNFSNFFLPSNLFHNEINTVCYTWGPKQMRHLLLQHLTGYLEIDAIIYNNLYNMLISYLSTTLSIKVYIYLFVHLCSDATIDFTKTHPATEYTKNFIKCIFVLLVHPSQVMVTLFCCHMGLNVSTHAFISLYYSSRYSVPTSLTEGTYIPRPASTAISRII